MKKLTSLFIFLTLILTNTFQGRANESSVSLNESPYVRTARGSPKTKPLSAHQKKYEKIKGDALSVVVPCQKNLEFEPGICSNLSLEVKAIDADVIENWAKQVSHSNVAAQKILKKRLGEIRIGSPNIFYYSGTKELEARIKNPLDQHYNESISSFKKNFNDPYRDFRQLRFLKKMLDFYESCLSVTNAFNQKGFMVRFSKKNPQFDYNAESKGIEIRKLPFIRTYPSLSNLTCYSQGMVEKGDLFYQLTREDTPYSSTVPKGEQNTLILLEKNLRPLEIKNLIITTHNEILECELKLLNTTLPCQNVQANTFLKRQKTQDLKIDLRKNYAGLKEISDKMDQLTEKKEDFLGLMILSKGPFSFSGAESAYREEISLYEEALETPELNSQVAQALREKIKTYQNFKGHIQSIKKISLLLLTEGIANRNEEFLKKYPWFQKKSSCRIN